jgi:hypothetical protein
MRGETPEGALLHEYFSGSSVLSFISGDIIMSGGGGAAFLSCAKAAAGTKSAAQIKNVFMLVLLLCDLTPGPGLGSTLKFLMR